MFDLVRVVVLYDFYSFFCEQECRVRPVFRINWGDVRTLIAMEIVSTEGIIKNGTMFVRVVIDKSIVRACKSKAKEDARVVVNVIKKGI